MTDRACDKSVTESAAASSVRVRWRRASSAAGRKRYQIIAISLATLATLAAVLFCLSTLASPQPKTVLVSLYLMPPAEEALGANAPFHPLSDQLFNMAPLNVEIVEPPVQDSKPNGESSETADQQSIQLASDSDTTVPSDQAMQKPLLPIEYRMTDWNAAIGKVAKSEELVLQVSSFARIEHDQVVFFGRDADATTRVSFSDLLATVGRSAAKRSLIVLDVGWPMVSDNGDSRARIERLDRLIGQQFAKSAPRGCHLLLSSYGPKSTSVIAGEPRSMLARALSAAIGSQESDTNHDGRTSVGEVVDWVSRIENSNLHGRRLPRLTLIGDGDSFSFRRIGSPRSAMQRDYPESLAGSWRRRGQYMRSVETPFLSDTAALWWTGLNDLESRWLRGEPLPSIERDVLRLERKCLQEILDALMHRRARCSDSLTNVAHRFPLESSEEATRLAIDLVSRQSEIFATVDANGRDLVTKKLVAEYVAKFQPDDAELALNAVLQTIEQTASMDIADWDLICKVCGSFPALSRYPIAQTITALAQQPTDYDRIANRLSLALIRDRLGINEGSSVILSGSVSRAFQDIVNAERLCASVGMSSDEATKRFIAQAVSSAEAVLVAERNVSRSLRSIESVILGLSIDDGFGLCRDSSQICDELIAAAEHSLELLARVKAKAEMSQTPPTTELAFLRQKSEAIERLIARRAAAVEQAYRFDTPTMPPMISAFVGPQQRLLMIGKDISLSSVPAVSLASLSVKSEPRSAKLVTRSIGESLAALRNQLDQIKSATVPHSGDGKRIERSIVSSNDADALILLSGDLRSLSWDNPDTSIELSLNPQFRSVTEATFNFLEPASAAIRVYPQSGQLVAGQSQRIEVSLRKPQLDATQQDLTGIWLQSSSQAGNSLIALAMDQQPATPRLDIDFGKHAEAKGRRICIPLWPNNDPQQLNWYLTSKDPAISAVVVTATSGSGVSVVSQPLEVHPGRSTRISFPPPMPKKANEAGNSLECPLSIVVTDSKTGSVLGHWTVETQVRDPRGLIQPGLAEFNVESSGKNRLTVNMERLPNCDRDPFAKEFLPCIRLELGAEQTTSLIDFGSSRLQSTIKSDQSMSTLYAEDLRFIEGEAPVGMIPISINGDRGYFELEGRFPRRSAAVRLAWDQQPRLRIRAGNATAPGIALQATIEARNLDDQDDLIIEVFGAADDHGVPVWHSRLNAPRQIVCNFESAGSTATFAVNALRRDWELAIPSNFGTGDYWIRASTIQKFGKSKAYAEHRFVIDAGVPSKLQARADLFPDRTVLNVACEPSVSGNVSLSVTPVVVTAGQKITPLVGSPIDSAGSRWQVSWPATIPLPEQVELVFVTGAGKEFTSTCDVRVQRIAPTGKIVGQVMEGSIAQPELTVTLRSMVGVDLANYKTSDSGYFEFVVPPGKYQLVTQKVATRRQAAMQVSVGQGEVRNADLSLQRTPPGGV